MTDLLQQFSDASLGAFSRRDALRQTGRLGLGAAVAAIPFLTAKDARAQSTDGDFGILNYALTLEYLERSFYRQAVDTGDIPADVLPLFTTLRDDEAAHVTLLRGAITDAGGDPVDYTDSDFAFGDFLGSFANIATLAQGLEDTGVRAYKGQAASIMNKDYLTVALQIHSVEARHAAAIRRLDASPAAQGWIPGDQDNAPGPIAPVYGAGSGFPSEDNVTQGGVDLTSALSGYTRDQITEAFDEGLDMDAVLGIAGQFISGDEGDGDD
ncbi:ferritin-like domain-containing protein [Rubrivirga sp.]|uniref:ferritin-like domain-containing protein n=1 Tax=Rubrivirga sp. TaxID=1885344 RepID=UPI003C71A658